MGVDKKETAGSIVPPSFKEHGESPWLRNFIVMAVMFSFGHSCVNAVYGLCSSYFDDKMANASSAIFNFFYALSSIFLTVPAVKIFGSKYTMVASATLYCFYVGAFGVIALLPSSIAPNGGTVQYAIALPCSMLGGIAGGCIWTAQGQYFGKAAHLYSEATGEDREKVNGRFAGIFTMIFLGFGTAMALCSTITLDFDETTGKPIIFAFYTVCAILGVFGLLFVEELPKDDTDKEEDDTPMAKLMLKKLGDIGTVCTDKKLWLLGPTSLLGGIFLPFLQYYLNGKLAVKSLGRRNIGLVISIPGGYATLMGIPYAMVAECVGKTAMLMSFGGAYLIIALLGLLAPAQLVAGHWLSFVGVNILMGHTRAVYQCTIFTVFADFFPDTQAGAFAMNNVYGGIIPVIGNIAFAVGKNEDLIEKVSGWSLVGMCVISFYTVPLAFWVQRKDKARREANKELTEDLLDERERQETAGGPNDESCQRTDTVVFEKVEVRAGTEATKSASHSKSSRKGSRSGSRKNSSEAV